MVQRIFSVFKVWYIRRTREPKAGHCKDLVGSLHWLCMRTSILVEDSQRAPSKVLIFPFISEQSVRQKRCLPVICKGRLSTKHEKVDVDPSTQNKRSIWSYPLAMSLIFEMLVTHVSRLTEAPLFRIHVGLPLLRSHEHAKQCDSLRAKKVVGFVFVRAQL